jgi:hypothetical protein
MSAVKSLWIITISFVALIVVAYFVPVKLGDINPISFCFFGIFVLGALGALRLRKPDWLWEIEAGLWRRGTGRELARTEWERRQKIEGIGSLVIAVLLLLFSLCLVSPAVQKLWMTLFGTNSQ